MGMGDGGDGHGGREGGGGWGNFFYGGIMAAISPLLYLHLQWSRMQGREHYVRGCERLGYSSLPRPPGPLIWFHAVSVGEGMAAIPVILRCMEVRPYVTVLLTTFTNSAHSVLKQRLPPEVLCQFAPFDTPGAVERFLLHWNPQAAVFIESELWPTLILASATKGIPLALLNARMSVKSFERWSLAPVQPLVTAMLSQFSLIAPLSTKEAVRYQILGAHPSVIHFAGNLKYACAAVDAHRGPRFPTSKLEEGLLGRKVWLAASTHLEEEHAISRIHKQVSIWVPRLLTIIAPRQPSRGHYIANHLRQQGFQVAVRSQEHPICSNTDVYVVDTLGELRNFYALAPVAFVGGSLVEGLAGHNVAEAAAAGCVVLTGRHIGHFQEMVWELQKLAPMSVQQVDGEEELLDVLHKLLTEEARLKERRDAAQRAFSAAVTGVVTQVWEALDSLVLTKALSQALLDASDSLKEERHVIKVEASSPSGA